MNIPHTIAIICATLISTAAAMAQSTIKFGYLNADSILHTMPDYHQAQADLQQLTQRYKAETQYNEQTFRRQYAELLQGQSQFTPNILAKRQADLQQALERNIKFRQQADSLLADTWQQLLAPVRQRLNQAIKATGIEHGYEYIIDTSTGAYPFIHPQAGQDATPYVLETLQRNEQHTQH